MIDWNEIETGSILAGLCWLAKAAVDFIGTYIKKTSAFSFWRHLKKTIVFTNLVYKKKSAYNQSGYIKKIRKLYILYYKKNLQMCICAHLKKTSAIGKFLYLKAA